MRAHIVGLLLAASACLASAVTGIRAFEGDSRTGTVVEYWRGYERLYAIAFAVFFAAAAYSIYRRFPLAWKLGLIAPYASAAVFVFLAWWYLWPQDYGWIGAAAATLFAPIIALHEARRWQRHRSYFFQHENEQT